MLGQNGLQFNMCNVDIPNFQSGVPNMSNHHLQDCVTGALGYSCKQWLSHVTAASELTVDILDMLQDFVQNKLLNWIEAQSILCVLGSMLPGLQMVCSLMVSRFILVHNVHQE